MCGLDGNPWEEEEVCLSVCVYVCMCVCVCVFTGVFNVCSHAGVNSALKYANVAVRAVC